MLGMHFDLMGARGSFPEIDAKKLRKMPQTNTNSEKGLFCQIQLSSYEKSNTQSQKDEPEMIETKS